jgi:hypothetical protein
VASQDDADQAFDALVEQMTSRGAVAAKMFGKRSLKTGSKAFACLFDDGVAVRLGAGTTEHTEALAAKGAVLFDPSGTDRPMRDWVWIPVKYAKRWPQFAEVARLRVAEP